MNKKTIGWVLSVCMVVFGFATASRAQASALYTAVPVSDSGTDNTLSYGNTARKVAVGPDGTIYVVYHSATLGVRIARSTNRGQSFEPSIQLDTAEGEPEVVVDGNSNVYVAWVVSGNIKLSRSTDHGGTFSAKATIGTTISTSVHMAVSSPYVYIIPPLADTLFINSSNGIGAFTTSPVDSSPRAYSDVHIDPVTGYVYIQDDDPNVLYFVSTNHGQTFSSAQNPGYNVWYSTTASSFNNTDKYIYVNGGPLGVGTDAASLRINLNNNTIVSTPFSLTSTSQSRSLAADDIGNVVDGFIDSGTLKYEVSNNKGVSVGTPVSVGAGDYISVAINNSYRDVVAAYSSSGRVYVSVYQNELLARNATPVDNGAVMFPGMFEVPDVSNVSFAINNDAPATTSASVTLQIKADPKITSMAVSNTEDFADVGIQPLASTLQWTLCINCELGKTYTVYFKGYNQYGRAVTLSKNITYKPGAKKMTSQSYLFTKNLKLGNKHSQVIQLQKYLNSNGFPVATSGSGSPGQETNVFGGSTKNAVMKFQAAHADEILTPVGLSTPNGIVGTLTRAYLNK